MTGTILSYEVQVSTHARQKGLGKGILELMKQYGTKYKMRKVVLTCLKGIVHGFLWRHTSHRRRIANDPAMEFYKRVGYGVPLIMRARI